MHPVLFQLPTPWGPQPVYAYGFMLALALVVGYRLSLRRVRTDGTLSEELAGNACFAAVLAGLLFGRLLYVAVNSELLEEGQHRWYELTSGGSMAYGAFFGGTLASFGYLRWKGARFAAFADAAAPGLTLGSMFTRIGCYLYGCDFGTRLPESAPGFLKALGTFPRWSGEAGLSGSPALLHHLDRYAIDQKASHSLPVHPTQLYEALLGLALFGLAIVWRKHRRFEGQVMLIVAMGYALGRFALESLRDEPDRGEIFRFSVAELGSLGLFALCAVLYSARRRGPRPAT